MRGDGGRRRNGAYDYMRRFCAIERCRGAAKCLSSVKLGACEELNLQTVVRLYTPEGHLKYESDVAPNNGYYMLPVYSTGKYVIKVRAPAGYTFRRYCGCEASAQIEHSARRAQGHYRRHGCMLQGRGH